MKITKIKIKIENFKSFKDEVEFEISDDKNISAIIGRNASGKTSFFEALYNLKRILKFNNQISLSECYNPYAFDETKKKENTVYTISWTESDDDNDRQYTYFVEFNGKEIVKEVLKNCDKTYFERTKLKITLNDDPKDIMNIATTAKGLSAFFLFTISSNSDKIGETVTQVYTTIHSIIDKMYVFTPEHKPDLNKAVIEAITNKKISDLTSEADPTFLTVMSKEAFDGADENNLNELIKELKDNNHINDKTFASSDDYVSYHMIDSVVHTIDYKHESSGTKKLFELSPYIYRVLDCGGYLFIDELDSQIHPSIIANVLIPLFANKNTNKLNAKLIFSMHNIGLVKYKEFMDNTLIFGLDVGISTKEFVNITDKIHINEEDALDKLIKGYYGGVPMTVLLETECKG